MEVQKENILNFDSYKSAFKEKMVEECIGKTDVEFKEHILERL